MRTVSIIALVLLLLAGSLGAQSTIPLPGFSSTFSTAALTRGFWFQAPVPFTIVGLQVPDESNHGKQNVAVYKLASAPPAYPASTTGGLLFDKGGEPSGTTIKCSITFSKGDHVGIIGACGDATTMRSSYATPSGPFATSVLGQATTITRLLTQTNLVAQQGKGPVSNESGGPLGRVNVYVVSPSSIIGSGTGQIGTSLVYSLAAPTDAGLPYQVANSFGLGPTPIGARKLGLTIDDLMVLSTSGLVPTVFNGYAGVLDTAGVGTAKLNIPKAALLKGYRIHAAFVTLKASAPFNLSTISGTFTFTIS